MTRPLLAIAGVLLAGGTAHAQSKRYPPEPVDKDREAAQQSQLWDKATNPSRKPYEDLLAQASELLSGRSPDGARDALKLLDQAVALMPREARAYRVRGDVHAILRDWSRCAADLQQGYALAKPRELDTTASIDARKRLGVCQLRAGRPGDAERTLAEAVASGAATGEVWMRLGETRIALGKLEEAISALHTAMNSADVPSPALVRFLLAGAYDRSRRPSEAARLAQDAVNLDRTLASLRNPQLPLLTSGEAEYLLGLAYSTPEPYPRPEHALVYFREFVRLAPESPWRKRAEDKLRELKAAKLPEIIHRASGNAELKLEVARDIVRKSMPAMRACMASVPTSVLNVLVTRVGPRSSTATVRQGDMPNPYYTGRVHVYAPPAGVTITVDRDAVQGAPTTDIDRAIECIDPIAARLPLPAIRDKDAWYRLSFPVVSP